MIIKRQYSNILKPYKIITFDTEAHKFKSNSEEIQTLALGSLYDGNNYYDFFNLQQFLKHVIALSKQYNKIMLIAHNMKYDLQILGLINLFISDNQFLGLDLKDKFLGEVNYFKFKNKKAEVIFLDSFNFYKQSLGNIAQSLGLEKYAHKEYNYSGKKWNRYIDNNGIELCHKDCYILYEKMKLVKQSSIAYGKSSASSSFREWITNYMPIEQIDLDDFNSIGEEIYHGGRTELYHRQIKEYSYSLDINSLYPYVMNKYKYSIKFHREIGISELEYVLNSIRNEHYNYLINISYKSSLPRTPIMQRTINGMLCDFQENSNIWITGQEFLLLYESDKALTFQMHKILEFVNCDLFSGYVKKFYKLKKDAKSESEKTDNKLMLNSLYGKFGQREKYNIFEPYSTMPELENFKSEYERITYNGIVYSLYDSFYSYRENGDYINCVVIASEITANARCENYRNQKLLGFNNIISTDTDSFRITKTFFDSHKELMNSIIGNEIGQLKIEHDKSGYHIGYGLKDYEIIDDLGISLRKTKGIRKNAILIGNNKYKMQVFKTLNKTKDKVILKDIIKQLSYDMVKLKYDESGISHIFKNQSEFIKHNKIKISASNEVK